MSADATCVICGRTILGGERVHRFVNGGQEHGVCELCVAWAERLGWRPAGEEQSGRPQRAPHEGRGRLHSLLHSRKRRRGHRSVSRPATSPPAPPAGSAAPAHPTQRAVARFNSSEAGRTVAGLVRTLGKPWVSVGALAGSPEEVRITVAWELSWYQWGVDIGDELRPVFQIGKGQELDQLDHAARQWNASAAADGRIDLGRGGERSAAGEPSAS